MMRFIRFIAAVLRRWFGRKPKPNTETPWVEIPDLVSPALKYSGRKNLNPTQWRRKRMKKLHRG